MITYALKCGEKYCHFGSYGKITLHDSPLRASLYSSQKLAEAKTRNQALGWYDGGRMGQIYESELKVVEITMTVVSECYL